MVADGSAYLAVEFELLICLRESTIGCFSLFADNGIAMLKSQNN
jgi:hypothetical protein